MDPQSGKLVHTMKFVKRIVFSACWHAGNCQGVKELTVIINF